MKNRFRSLLCFLLVFCLFSTPVVALETKDALGLLEQFYVDELPAEAYRARSLDELLSLLNDPYTVYMSQDEYEQFVNQIHDASVVGIGVSIQNHEDGLLIISVLDNSPALEAGLVAGDIIQAVNSIPVKTTEEGTALITGQEGTSVQLTILRQDGSVLEITLMRRTVVIPTTVQYALSEDGNAGVILCSSFGNGTAKHFKEAIQTHEETVNAWIIDLSANPGGTDVAAASAAGWFIGGAPMVYYRNGAGQYSYVYTHSFVPVLTEKPAVILTSNYSASGSELFSAAMRDHGAGISVGQRTFGKGVAQTIMTADKYPELFDGDALKVTIYRFFSPNGTTNDKIGLLPTLLISPEQMYNAALLLCADAPENAKDHLKVHLSGWDFYVDLNTALSDPFRPAFVELLNSLIPTTPLWKDDGSGQWVTTTVPSIAREFGLTDSIRPTFTDLEGCAQADAIQTLAAYHLISGFGDGTFRPDDGITRAQLCAMLVNLLNLDTEPVAQSRFYDVAEDVWYAPAVHAVYERGFMGEYSDNAFHPNMLMTQQDLIGVLANVACFLNMHAYESELIQPTYEDLAPYTNFSIRTRKPAWILGSLGLDLSGLDSRSRATRGTAADLFCQLMRQTNLLWQ